MPITVKRTKISILLLSASLLVTVFLLAFNAWLLSVSSIGMMTSSLSPTPFPDPSNISLATRYSLFLADIVQDRWLIVPLFAAGITGSLKWRSDKVSAVAFAVLGCNVLLIYHTVFILLNSSPRN